ncbi:unnamed protein product [Ilex paraguariensis]|uniref:Uncharacterized protein n=1 Tax=Ilex paraguariensis TaxID=185542 RepID=A0ABC8SNC8_9AQUA
MVFVIEVKPVNSRLAGVKRKFETPIAGGDDAAALATMSKKSHKWSCGLCQVSATCEQGLKDHLKGKKHNAKEKASLRNSKTFSDNSGDYLLPEETKQCGELSLPTGSTSPKLHNITDENQDTNPKLKLMKGSGKVNAGLPVREEDNTFGSENSNSKFWCSICKVGTTSEASMTTHRMGKKHMNLLQQNGGGVIAIKMMPFNIPSVDAPIETAAKQGKLDSFAHAYKEVYRVGADWEADASKGEL